VTYLIDGHNLIPKMGISLSDPDDEEKLLELLEEFSRLARKKVEVYFDRAPAGYPKTQRRGNVLAHFVPQGTPADDAIIARLKKMGRSAANWTTVTSDNRILAEARASRASILTSEDFARYFAHLRSLKSVSRGEPEISDDEIQEWLKIFREKE